MKGKLREVLTGVLIGISILCLISIAWCVYTYAFYRWSVTYACSAAAIKYNRLNEKSLTEFASDGTKIRLSAVGNEDKSFIRDGYAYITFDITRSVGYSTTVVRTIGPILFRRESGCGLDDMCIRV
jgi:hypothetical protein